MVLEIAAILLLVSSRDLDLVRAIGFAFPDRPPSLPDTFNAGATTLGGPTGTGTSTRDGEATVVIAGDFTWCTVVVTAPEIFNAGAL